MATRRSSRFYWLIGAVGTNRLVTRLHPIAYRLTGGRGPVGRNLGVRNVIVETVGRRSGRVREIPLYAFEDGDRLIVIGSNMGSDREPAWVGNLLGQPRTRVRVGRDVLPMRARIAESAERERLWALAVRGYPGYDHYARWTERSIPVVVLDPEPAVATA
jgi:F420H(2)-dependent quinone reductase